MNLWIRLPQTARVVSEKLMRRGWLVRTGDEFLLGENAAPSEHLRLTVHDLNDADAERLVADIAAAAR